MRKVGDRSRLIRTGGNDMTIDEELSIIRDNIAEYGQTNITQEEYNMIYNKAIDDFEGKLLYQIGCLDIRDIIQETAEQLKAGVNNGTD